MGVVRTIRFLSQIDYKQVSLCYASRNNIRAKYNREIVGL